MIDPPMMMATTMADKRTSRRPFITMTGDLEL
jgi:hypothetical protein